MTTHNQTIPDWSPPGSTRTTPSDGLAGEEEKVANSDERLDKASTAYGMEICAKKTKLMTNTSGINTEIKVNGQQLESHKLQIPGLSYN